MDSLQPTLTTTMNEQTPVDQAFYHEVSTQSDTESAASTVPPDETPSCVTANITGGPGCGENDQVMRVPSRSLREVAKHDYAYRAYEEAMDGATATATATATPSKSRRRKPGLGKRARESTDLDFVLDEFSQKVRRQGQAWTEEIQKLRDELAILNDQKNRLQEELRISNSEKDCLRQQLVMSNHERDRLREDFTISKQQNDEKIRDLQRVVDDQKKSTYLLCQGCGEAKKYWRIFGCGHAFCTGCISEFNTKEPLFNSCCPCCQEPIQICINFDPKTL
ncbi:hypothetical protein PMAA_078770 [Talaromyces marneffei ATCC 18224]|uniref:RING-type domain-containing protein n=1 Tax=Talaromyces marneffei (strain ATCC 18224 / CBS 334.59 / QM 7333) TaxID=441960 RepID=B6QDX9_TALMQ|nr:hypothetical protein PMAA_078770 [Talaromyces marneffei ATCC 18224]